MRFIESDVFDIAKRLKEVDPTYKLNYNGKTKKFELYGGKKCERLIVFPFNAMDERMVIHARKTRVERMDALIRELDEENERLERDEKSASVQKAMAAAEDALSAV